MATHNFRFLLSWKQYLAVSLLLATVFGCNSQSSSQVLPNLKKMNQSQQEYRLANSYFASSIGDLNIPLDKQTPYRYTIRIIDKTLVMHVAQPTRSQLPSYIALIDVRESQNSASTIICKTDIQITDIAISSQVYPAVARQRSQDSPLQCPPDFTQL
jgi:hypothetical protein